MRTTVAARKVVGGGEPASYLQHMEDVQYMLIASIMNKIITSRKNSNRVRAFISLMTHGWMFLFQLSIVWFLKDLTLAGSLYVLWFAWVRSMENTCQENNSSIVYWSGAVYYLVTRHWPQDMFTLAAVSKITKSTLWVMEIWTTEKVFLIFNPSYLVLENIKELCTSGKFVLYSCR